MTANLPPGLRVLVAGSANDRPASDLAAALGAALLAGGGRTVITGGSPGKIDADVVAGARGAGGDVTRCVTFLTRPHDGPTVLAPAFAGTTAIVARGWTRQARRFEMVQHADVVVTFGGHRSVPTMIAMAEALDIPVLPLPFTGGASAAAWQALRQDRAAFRDAAPAESVVPTAVLDAIDGLDLGQPVDGLAREVAHLIDAAAVRSCFVARPYDDATTTRYERLVTSAIEGAGMRVVDLSRSRAAGLINLEIEDRIRTAGVVLAVLTAPRPGPGGGPGANANVTYEVGFAHALGIPTVLVAATDDAELPFDLRNHRVFRVPTPGVHGFDERVTDELAGWLREARRRASP